MPNTKAPSFSLLLALLAWMTVSCSPEGGSGRWAGTVSDSAGIRLVHNPHVGLWGPDQGWSFTEALTIGQEVGDPNYEFGKVTSIQVDPEGDIFVFDGMASEIRVYDPAGTHLLSMGGRGEGPGELSGAAAGAFLTRDGRLLVPDMGAQRITSMATSGEVLGSVRVSYASGFPVRWDADGSGGVLVQRRAMGFNEDPDLAAGGPSGTIRTAMTQSYRIELRNPDGFLRSIITKPWEERPVTDAVYGNWLDEVDRAHVMKLDLTQGV